MIVALYGVAFAMIAVGSTALVQGYGIIMVERGWTFVIAGTVAVTGGLILIGIAYAASRLNRLIAETVKLRDRMGRLDAIPDRIPPRLAEPEAVLPPKPPGLVASERLREEAERIAARREPPLTEPPSPPAAVEAAALSGPVPEREEPRGEAAEASLTDETEPPLVGVPVPSRPEASEADTAVEAVEEEAAEPVPEEAIPEPPTPTVVGTYNSGGNRYVMFSDGSIRAETPNGVFRFKSLDELKEFVASGGESAAGPESKAG